MPRMTFPQDRTSFVYQGPTEPILTPPRTAIELFDDVACTARADVLTLDENPIADATIYTGVDGLVPEFLGPTDGRLLLYARVVGTETVYGLEACLSDAVSGLMAIVNDLSARDPQNSFVSGQGSPGPQDGVIDGFYLDVDSQQLWGPKVDAVTWPQRAIQLGVPEIAATYFDYTIVLPTTQVIIDHPLTSNTPSVIYTNTEDEEELCGVSYPTPSRVMVSFGAPSTGRIHLAE